MYFHYVIVNPSLTWVFLVLVWNSLIICMAMIYVYNVCVSLSLSHCPSVCVSVSVCLSECEFVCEFMRMALVMVFVFVFVFVTAFVLYWYLYYTRFSYSYRSRSRSSSQSCTILMGWWVDGVFEGWWVSPYSSKLSKCSAYSSAVWNSNSLSSLLLWMRLWL